MAKKTNPKITRKFILKTLIHEFDSTCRLVGREVAGFGDKALREMCGENTSASYRKRQKQQQRRRGS